MKNIEAVVRQHTLDIIKKKLVDAGFCGMMVTEIRGCGQQVGHSEMYRGA